MLTRSAPVRSPLMMIPKTGIILLLLACGSFLIPFFRSKRGNVDAEPLAVSADVVDAGDQPIDLNSSQVDASPVKLMDQKSSTVGSQDEAQSAAPQTASTEATSGAAAQPSSDQQSSTLPIEAQPNQVLPRDEQLSDTQLELRDLLSIVSDNTLLIHKREMPAYWRLLSISMAEDYGTQYEKARRNPSLNEFHTAAAKHRGELVSLNLNIRRVVQYDAIDANNPANVKQLYEVWGWTEQSKSWLYVCVTPELPPGMQVGEAVSFRAQFTGYFFKMLAYHSAKPTSSGMPRVAPMLIGRFSTERLAPLRPASDPLQVFIWVVFAVVCVGGFFMRWILKRTDKPMPVLKNSSPEADDASRFDWVDDIQPADKSKDATLL